MQRTVTRTYNFNVDDLKNIIIDHLETGDQPVPRGKDADVEFRLLQDGAQLKWTDSV